MALFAEVGRFADDVIFPLLNVRDPQGFLPIVFCPLSLVQLHIVTYGDGVGTADATDAEVAFYPALRIRTIVQADDVTATR